MKQVKMKHAIVVLLAAVLGACNAQNKDTGAAVEPVEPKGVSLESQKAKLGYMYGVQAASEIMRSGLNEEIELEAMFQAFRDITAGQEPKMSIEEMQLAQATFQQEQQAKFAKTSGDNLASGAAHLAENGKLENVTTTESGLQYEVLREGKGKQPAKDSTVKVHYAGKLIDGTEFDSSYARGEPVDFPVTGVIPGFSEGLLLMKEGAKYKLTIPAGIAYGEQGPASIGPNQVLVFEVELIEVL